MSRYCYNFGIGTLIISLIAIGDIQLLTNQCTATLTTLKTINRLKQRSYTHYKSKIQVPQYSSPSDSDDSSSSDSDSDIEGTENITVARRYLHRHSASSDNLYTNPMPLLKRFRTSTPEPPERQPDKEPIRCPLKEIVNHRPALHIPPVDLTVAPGRRAANIQLGRQRVNAMAGRG